MLGKDKCLPEMTQEAVVTPYMAVRGIKDDEPF